MVDRQKYFYNPKEGRCGDYIPFYWNGTYHLFYILGIDWQHISTKDFVNFTEHPLALKGEGIDKQDRNIFTGSVIEKDGLFHIFYTGHNSEHDKYGLEFVQVVMHATSKDLDTWVKDEPFRLPPLTSIYSPGGWRDPFVFWNDEAKCYWMIITTATRVNFAKRWGCTALFVSDDLVTWKHEKVLYAPSMFDSHECPDMFKLGDTWYLVFSTYTRWWETHYRVSKSPYGPWKIPNQDDLFDGRAFYAAKTVTDGKRRFIVGWSSVRDEENDEKTYLWGGSLTVHEIVQRKDGTLGVKVIPEIERTFTKPVELNPKAIYGDWQISDNKIKCKSNGFSVMSLATTGEACMIKAKVHFTKDTSACGIILRSEPPVFEKWCAVRVEPGKQRITFDRFNKFFVDHYFDEERPLKLQNNAEIKIVAYGSLIVTYVNDVALTVRSYKYLDGVVGLFVESGSAEFYDIQVMQF